MPKNNNFDRRGGTPNSGLRGLVKDDVAKRDQRIMRGNAALIASLKPALTPEAKEIARAKVALDEAHAKVEAARAVADRLSRRLPYSAQDAVRAHDVDVLPAEGRPAHFTLKWDDHGTWWNEGTYSDDLLPAVEEAIEAWVEVHAVVALSSLAWSAWASIS